jgi:hypothetical protein
MPVKVLKPIALDDQWLTLAAVDNAGDLLIRVGRVIDPHNEPGAARPGLAVLAFPGRGLVHSTGERSGWIWSGRDASSMSVCGG